MIATTFIQYLGGVTLNEKWDTGFNVLLDEVN